MPSPSQDAVEMLRQNKDRSKLQDSILARATERESALVDVTRKLHGRDPEALTSMKHKRLAEALAHASRTDGESLGPKRLPTYLHEQALQWGDDLHMGDVIRKALMKKTSSARKDRDIELWEQWKRTKSQHDLQQLMRQMDGAIQSEVNRWTGAIARPVLEAKAKRLALEAFETYDPNMGAALNTHLTNRLKKLSREVYTHQDAVRLPEYKKLKVHTYTRGTNELMSTLGREPTNQELQDHLAWSPQMVSSVQRSLMPELIESADVGGGMFERQSVWGSDGDDGLVDMFYYDLDPIDKLIFEHSTGYSGKKVLSNPELMRKTSLTQGQLSYRKRKIIDRLRALQG
jgi:hypothetical protein